MGRMWHIAYCRILRVAKYPRYNNNDGKNTYSIFYTYIEKKSWYFH